MYNCVLQNLFQFQFQVNKYFRKIRQIFYFRPWKCVRLRNGELLGLKVTEETIAQHI